MAEFLPLMSALPLPLLVNPVFQTAYGIMVKGYKIALRSEDVQIRYVQCCTCTAVRVVLYVHCGTCNAVHALRTCSA